MLTKPAQTSVQHVVDGIQQHLTKYACELTYSDLPANVVHAAKVRLMDTLGSLIAGFFGEPCRIGRRLAMPFHVPRGATIVGTANKVAPDLAALVNGTTARYAELTDVYTWPGSSQGHPSDTLMPMLGFAEYACVDGRSFIENVVVSYEVYQRMCDAFHNLVAFDNTSFVALATSIATSRMLRLSPAQISHAISMAVVPNVILRQARLGHYKAVAAGHAGQAGISAALLAQAGMEGPHLPFEGKAGWCDQVAKERFTLENIGASFKILDSRLKPRPAADVTIPSILAAEKIAPLKDFNDVRHITVEVNKKAKDAAATGEHRWKPESREAADHSVPYVVAATLMDGTITLRSFDDAHLTNEQLRTLMRKIAVVENPDFAKAFDRLPQEHRARITVETQRGRQLVGKSGGSDGDMSEPMSDLQVEAKFRGLVEDVLSSKQTKAVLDRLWNLEQVENMAEIPAALRFV